MSNLSCVGNYWYTNNINLSFSWLQWNVKHEIITIILGLQWNQGLIKHFEGTAFVCSFLSPIQYSLFVCAIQMSKLNSIPSQLFNVKSQQKNYDRIMVHINHCCGKWQFIKHDLCTTDVSSQNTWTCCLLNKRSKLHGSLVGNLILAQIIICHLA